jgi:hypothetical protein
MQQRILLTGSINIKSMILILIYLVGVIASYFLVRDIAIKGSGEWTVADRSVVIIISVMLSWWAAAIVGVVRLWAFVAESGDTEKEAKW